jgi:hypothetical protein
MNKEKASTLYKDKEDIDNDINILSGLIWNIETIIEEIDNFQLYEAMAYPKPLLPDNNLDTLKNAKEYLKDSINLLNGHRKIAKNESKILFLQKEMEEL